MFCSKCGCKIREADMICPECGAARSEMEYNGGFWDLVGEGRTLTEGKTLQATNSVESGKDNTLKKEERDVSQSKRNLISLSIVSILFIVVLAFSIFQTVRAVRTAEKYNKMKEQYDDLSAGYEELMKNYESLAAGYEELMKNYESLAQQYEEPETEDAANSPHTDDAEGTAAAHIS